MISWMQKHKKYLVITIWISTIAFVGAGFVGWGAYKYGSSGDTMVEVGDTKVTIKEFQNRYSQLYNYYNQLFGGKLDQQKAKEMGLDKMAFEQLIKEALLLNYAKEHGLIVTDEEVAKKIESMKVFQQDGHFSKKLYLNVLKQNRIRPKDFEESIKKELLLAKIKEVFKPKLLPLEFDSASAALFMGDKIAYKPLSADDINITYTQKELKRYYNEHRDNYKTPMRYKLSLIEAAKNLIDEENAPVALDDALHQIKKSFFLQEENNTKDNLVAFYVTDLLSTDRQRLTINYRGYKGILGYNVGSASVIGNTCMLQNPDYDFYMDVNFRGHFSLRSNNKLDVSQMAAEVGNGGGHPNASGGKIDGYKDSFVYADVRKFVQNYIDEKSK